MSRYSYGYGYGDPEGYGGFGQSANAGLGQSAVTRAIAESLLTPLAQAGASVGVEAQKAQVNKARIKAGKQLCTGQHGQPFDCPAMFAPAAFAPVPGARVPVAAVPAKKSNTLLIVVGLLAVGGVAFYFMTQKKQAA